MSRGVTRAKIEMIFKYPFPRFQLLSAWTKVARPGGFADEKGRWHGTTKRPGASLKYVDHAFRTYFIPENSNVHGKVVIALPGLEATWYPPSGASPELKPKKNLRSDGPPCPWYFSSRPSRGNFLPLPLFYVVGAMIDIFGEVSTLIPLWQEIIACDAGLDLRAGLVPVTESTRAFVQAYVAPTLLGLHSSTILWFPAHQTGALSLFTAAEQTRFYYFAPTSGRVARPAPNNRLIALLDFRVSCTQRLRGPPSGEGDKIFVFEVRPRWSGGATKLAKKRKENRKVLLRKRNPGV
jgi:hypothetical protein